MIQLKDVSKTYKTSDSAEVFALKNVSVTFGDTGLCFIVGKSGSGKSTLLNLLGGLDAATNGSIFVDGKDMSSMDRKSSDDYRRNKVGFIFQSYNLLEEISVKDNLSLALMLKGVKTAKRNVADALASVGLEGYADRKPSELSGGQRQRVAVARALIKRPSIILADEPTGNLDSETSAEVFELLKRLSQEYAVIVVTHDRESAELYGDRIIEIADGCIVGDSSPYQFANQCAADTTDDVRGKNKLGAANTVKLGAKFMSRHTVRMLITLILFAFSLTLFGVGYTAAAYDRDATEYDLYSRQGDQIVQFQSQIYSYVANEYSNISKKQYEAIQKALPEFEFKGVYELENETLLNLYFPQDSERDAFYGYPISGVTSLKEEELQSYGMVKLVGEMPSASDEIALPSYIADKYLKYGVYDNDLQYFVSVKKYAELLGHTVAGMRVVGIVDTGCDFSRYEILKSEPPVQNAEAESEYIDLQITFEQIISGSVHNALFVSERFVKDHFFEKPQARGNYYVNSFFYEGVTSGIATYFSAISYDRLQIVKAKEFDALKDNETIVAKDTLKNLYINENPSVNNQDITDEMLQAFFANGVKVKIILSKDGLSTWSESAAVEFDVVGYVDNGNYEASFYFNNALIDKAINTQNVYKSIFTTMSGNRQKDIELISTLNSGALDESYRFPINWQMRKNLDANEGNAEMLSKVGLYACIAFCVFAVLMMMNFISTAMASSRKQIGILCALGASMREVTGIYLLESLIIGAAAFAVALPAIYGISYALNTLLYGGSMTIPFMLVSFKQPLTALALAIVTCVLGVILPIVRLRKKKPIEIINS